MIKCNCVRHLKKPSQKCDGYFVPDKDAGSKDSCALSKGFANTV